MAQQRYLLWRLAVLVLLLDLALAMTSTTTNVATRRSRRSAKDRRHRAPGTPHGGLHIGMQDGREY